MGQVRFLTDLEPGAIATVANFDADTRSTSDKRICSSAHLDRLLLLWGLLLWLEYLSIAPCMRAGMNTGLPESANSPRGTPCGERGRSPSKPATDAPYWIKVLR